MQGANGELGVEVLFKATLKVIDTPLIFHVIKHGYQFTVTFQSQKLGFAALADHSFQKSGVKSQSLVVVDWFSPAALMEVIQVAKEYILVLAALIHILMGNTAQGFQYPGQYFP